LRGEFTYQNFPGSDPMSDTEQHPAERLDHPRASGDLGRPDAGGGAHMADHLMPTEPPPSIGRDIATSPERNLVSAIVELARDPTVDVAKLSALVEMQERMERRQAEIAFTRAFAELPGMRVKKNGRVSLIRKDGTDGGTYPFARWEDIDTIISPLLVEKGFRLTFDSQPRQGDGGGLVVTGTLLHRDGHSRAASMPLALDTGPGRNNLQAMGSTLSYGRRYCAEMLLNIVREGDDDDGVKGGDELVTDQQVAELSRDMTAASFSERSMFDLLGVTNLGEIRKSQLAIARNAINMRKRQRGA
jgi:hypothetical protein